MSAGEAVLGSVAGPDAGRWARRALTIPAVFVGAGAMLALAPLWLPLAAAADVLGRRSALARSLCFATWWLVCECAGLCAAAGIAAMGPWGGWTEKRRLAARHRLQWRWAGWLLEGARRCFGLRFEVRGAECAAPGPVVVLMRHSSLADAFLGAVFLSAPNELWLRYVLKRELLWDPCLDVVGQVMPNAFVRRGSGSAEREIQAIRALAHDLGRRDGVLIYPEGTRFTPDKRAAALERIRAGDDPTRAERVAGLRAVLPVRLGGPLALLEAAGCDVVVVAHAGMEGAASAADLLRGALVRRRIAIEVRRFPAAAIPSGRAGRIAWLDARWAEVDAFVCREGGHG